MSSLYFLCYIVSHVDIKV